MKCVTSDPLEGGKCSSQSYMAQKTRKAPTKILRRPKGTETRKRHLKCRGHAISRGKEGKESREKKS